MAAGDHNLPRDAKTIIAMLRSMGVDSYEPRVIRQFQELYYRTAVDLLMDAKTYSNYAGKARVDYADVKLAIKSKSHFSGTRPTLPEVEKAAMKVNSQPIPRAPTTGPSLPPQWETLIASDYYCIEIERNQSTAAVEEQEVQINAGKTGKNVPRKQVRPPRTTQQQRANSLPRGRQRGSRPLGLNRGR